LVRRLELVGIILLAAGLVTLALEDPVIRILVYGTSFGAGSAATRAQFFNSTGTGGSLVARGTFGGAGATELVATLAAFCASVVGLVLIVTSILTRGGAGSQARPEARSGQ